MIVWQSWTASTKLNNAERGRLNSYLFALWTSGSSKKMSIKSANAVFMRCLEVGLNVQVSLSLSPEMLEKSRVSGVFYTLMDKIMDNVKLRSASLCFQRLVHKVVQRIVSEKERVRTLNPLKICCRVSF